MTTIYFCRHGESTGNVKFTFQGSTDNPLTENGRAQCALLARRLRDVPLDCIYSSPLSRAWETGKMINEYHRVPLIIDTAFQEICCGAMEDTDMLELHSSFPRYMHWWDEEPWKFRAPMGDDTMAARFEAMERGLRRLTRDHPGQTVLVSSHGGALRMFNCIAQGLDITHLGEMGWGDNTCLSCAEFEADGTARLVMKNDTAHVDPSMITPDFWLIKDELRAKRDRERGIK